MVMDAAEPRLNGYPAHWAPACAWLLGLIAYCAAIVFASERAGAWINDLAWTFASALAALACFRTARRVKGLRRRAWLLLGCGCTSWFIGQLHWNYHELVLDVRPYPSFAQVFYGSFSVFAIAAVLQLPASRQGTPFTFKKLGNIGLVSCCMAVTVVVGILEPALQTDMTALFVGIAVGHAMLVSATFLVSLYALWTYRWGVSWTPMLMLTAAASIYAVSNLVHANSVITGSYLPDDLINAGWLVMFGLISIAACEQSRLHLSQHAGLSPRMEVRERWIEAVVPALLIVIMAIVAVASLATMTPRAGYLVAGLFIVFAVLLGAREAWIQNESQLLTSQLVATNERLQTANAELRLSEVRYRELNAELELRVTERTGQLKAAYDELEGFSYAVAHDLKAPLRAINGFAHLLEAELDPQLTSNARKQLARIRNGSTKMAELIDDLLAYSHIDRRGLQARIIALPALIDSVVAHHADEIARRRVDIETSVDRITLRADAEGLALALRNLFENALKYTLEQPQPRITITACRSADCVHLSFVDNGIGFDMEFHDHIFKIFQRLHRDDRYPGTGIGLALVRKAIDRLGGRVWAESKAGAGAKFYVELPARLVDCSESATG